MSKDILDLHEFAERLPEFRILKPYDSSIEKRVDHLWLGVDHAGILGLLREMSNEVSEVMVGLPDSDAELKHLRTVVQALPRIQRSPAMRIALVGAQGAGKSLLINALFDIDGLSLTGADGGACTSAIIQYSSCAAGQNEHGEKEDKFFAAVHFLDAVKREEMLKEHARSYYHYYEDDDSDDDSDDESTRKTKHGRRDENDRRLKDTAEGVFHTLFGGKDAFQDVWYSHDYSNGEFVKICQMKCKEALSQLDADTKNTATFFGGTPQELLKQIRRFMASVKDEVSLWPLVDNISIRFHHPLLDQNIEIIDLPGWGDINLSRTRHTDQIKDSVDVELIIADTIRIATDEMVISNARGAILNHSAANVKLVATKIDAISDNQLAQCTGPDFNCIKNRMLQAERDWAAAEDEDDLRKRDEIEKYRIYLQRKLKVRKIEDRERDITQKLSMQLKAKAGDEKIRTYHVSAADYMGWITKDKVRFNEQPALDPARTKIPEIRQWLYNLPAQTNYDDTVKHLFVTVPAFLEKMRRVFTEAERDIGFKNLADDFDEYHDKEIVQLRSECQEHFHKLCSENLTKVKKDSKKYKDAINNHMEKTLLEYKAASFNRIAKTKGLVLPGVSRSKEIEGGCDFNREIATILAPAFQKWYTIQLRGLVTMRKSLKDRVDAFYLSVLYILANSEAGISTVDKAKKKWQPFRHKLSHRVDTFMDDFEKKLKGFFHRTIMQDDHQNSLIPYVTDELWEKVFTACPRLKPNSDPEKKRYVMPKTKFRKEEFRTLFLEEKNHIMDKVMKAFQMQVDNTTNTLLEREIGIISHTLKAYSDGLRAQAPIPYTFTTAGTNIRTGLETLYPKMQEKANRLIQFLPQHVKQEDQPHTTIPQADFVPTKPSPHNLSFYLDKNSKRKKGSSELQVKIKHEHSMKRSRLE